MFLYPYIIIFSFKVLNCPAMILLFTFSISQRKILFLFFYIYFIVFYYIIFFDFLSIKSYPSFLELFLRKEKMDSREMLDKLIS